MPSPESNHWQSSGHFREHPEWRLHADVVNHPERWLTVIAHLGRSSTHRHNKTVGRSVVVGFCGQSASSMRPFHPATWLRLASCHTKRRHCFTTLNQEMIPKMSFTILGRLLSKVDLINPSANPSTSFPIRTKFLPTQRYASAGNSDRNVSVHLSVCHEPVLCQNKVS